MRQGLSMFICVALIAAIFDITPAAGQESQTYRFDVTQYGAVADGKTLNTSVFQTLIDSCSNLGGGTVYVPPGKFLTGTIVFKDNVTLYLENGAVLLGSQNIENYLAIKPGYRALRTNQQTKQLFYAEGADNIAIRGRGTIDGQGKIFEKQDWNDEGITRPHLIQFIQCQHVFIEGVTLRNSGCWMQHYLACDYLTIRGITVYNHCNYNNDMLDIDGCRYVTVSDCIGDSDDDALTFKSTSPRACENIVVTNCILSSHCNAIKMGTESTGGFKNITISNCVVRPSAVETNFFGKRRGLAGIALEIVDGGIMDGIAISDIRIEGTTAPVFMRLGNRARPYMQNIPKPGIGQMRNIKICDIIATGADTNGCAISGLPDFPIENVTLSNINIQFCGGGSADLVRTDIPENEAKYPESTMFGKLPAFGFFVRHVSGMTLNNLNLSFVDSDQRPALVFDDVKTLDVYGLKAQNPSSGQPLVLMNNVSDVYVTASRLGNADPAIKITGDSSRDIFIQGNREENLREKVQIEERMNNKP